MHLYDWSKINVSIIDTRVKENQIITIEHEDLMEELGDMMKELGAKADGINRTGYRIKTLLLYIFGLT